MRPQSTIVLGAGPDLPLPHGFGSRRTWEFAVGLLGQAVAPERLAELVAGTAIAGYRDGEVTVSVPDPTRAEILATGYADLIARKLGEAMRRPIRVAFLTVAPDSGDPADSADVPGPAATPDRSPAAANAARPNAAEAAGSRVPSAPRANDPGASDDEALPIPSFLVTECRLPSGQVWAAVLEEVAARGEVSRANVDAWLRGTVLLGRDEHGGLIVGAPHALAQRRVADRFLSPLRAAVAAVVGTRLPVAVVAARDWLRAHPADPDREQRATLDGRDRSIDSA